MNRSIPVFFMALAAPLAAQSTTATAVTSTSATTTSSLAPLERSGGFADAYSSGTPHNSLIANQLADSMPHYAPPKPPPPPKPTTTEVDLRDVDKPKNHINRLPAYLVHGDKPPIFNDKVTETHNGRALLGLQKYKGLNLSPILNQHIAEQMQYDDERLQNMAELQDEANDIGRGVRSDSAEKDFIQEQSQNTYMRQDSGYTPRGPGG